MKIDSFAVVLNCKEIDQIVRKYLKTKGVEVDKDIMCACVEESDSCEDGYKFSFWKVSEDF